MHKLGLVDEKPMREFDLRCLTTVEDMSAKLRLHSRYGPHACSTAQCWDRRNGMAAATLITDAS